MATRQEIRKERSDRFVTEFTSRLPWTHIWGTGEDAMDFRISAVRTIGNGSLELKVGWRKGGVIQPFSNPWVLTGINDLVKDPTGTIIRQGDIYNETTGEWSVGDVTYRRDPVAVLKEAIIDLARELSQL
jgi:hypothetical protein